jgi:hypothetical protein
MDDPGKKLFEIGNTRRASAWQRAHPDDHVLVTSRRVRQGRVLKNRFTKK